METKYPNYIFDKIKQAYGIEENDNSRNKEFNNMSPDEVFKAVLNFDGLLGNWDYYIKKYIKDIYGVEIGNDELESI